jgi:hypothetical protein
LNTVYTDRWPLLSPAIWIGECNQTNALAQTSNGWTQPKLAAFLKFVDSIGIMSIGIWCMAEMGCSGVVPPTNNTHNLTGCVWMYDEIRAWRQRPTTGRIKPDDSACWRLETRHLALTISEAEAVSEVLDKATGRNLALFPASGVRPPPHNSLVSAVFKNATGKEATSPTKISYDPATQLITVVFADGAAVVPILVNITDDNTIVFTVQAAGAHTSELSQYRWMRSVCAQQGIHPAGRQRGRTHQQTCDAFAVSGSIHVVSIP